MLRKILQQKFCSTLFKLLDRSVWPCDWVIASRTWMKVPNALPRPGSQTPSAGNLPFFSPLHWRNGEDPEERTYSRVEPWDRRTTWTSTAGQEWSKKFFRIRSKRIWGLPALITLHTHTHNHIYIKSLSEQCNADLLTLSPILSPLY